MELLKTFAAEFGKAADETREDLVRGSRESAAQRLHTLRGVAGYVGAMDLIKSALVLENAIKDQRSDLEPLIAEFEQKLDTILKASTPWRV